MSKEHNAKITVAWITGGLGCFGAICTAIVTLIAALMAKQSNPASSNLTVNIPTSPPAITNVVPTKAETTFRVVNNTTQDICYIYLLPHDQGDDWGQNWLDLGSPLEANTTITFTIDTGMYDFRAEDCQQQLVEEYYDDHLQGDMTWTVDGQ